MAGAGSSRQVRRRLRALLAALALAAAWHATLGADGTDAFAEAPTTPRTGRRSGIFQLGSSLLGLGFGTALPVRAELSPPVEKALARYKETMQNGMDFLVFDLQRSLNSREVGMSEAFRDMQVEKEGGMGTPVESFLLVPLRQLVLASEDDDVDWKPIVARVEENNKLLREGLRTGNKATADQAFAKLLADVTSLFADINKVAGENVMAVPLLGNPDDDPYSKREERYMKLKARGKGGNKMRTPDEFRGDITR
eukprot:TRINITY_DN34292_c0_g1_i1.p1 TRINITY_DN34292_c0_g1~~TRINITY_DN34292_c0_g1_i1.p1  ORF type:complete len:253 (-),score=58.07 TRINITY_DN34292_c0_g1_i1:99-857(-)